MQHIGTVANDILVGGVEDDELLGRAGDDVLHGDRGDDVLRGGSGQDQLFGGTGRDHLYGGLGDDVLDGGAGADVLRGGQGDDQLIGGTGNDRAVFSGARADYTITWLDDTHILVSDTRVDGDGSDTLALDIELIRFSDGVFNLTEILPSREIVIVGTAEADTLTGTDTAETFRALEGDDVIRAMGGDDTIFAELGSDWVYGGDGNDTLVLSGNRSDYVVTFVDGALVLGDLREGQPDGWETVYEIESFRFLDGTLDLWSMTRDFDNTIIGTEGADMIDPGAGLDSIDARGGDDTILIGTGGERVHGGDGIDTAVFSGSRADYDIYQFAGPAPNFETDPVIIGVYGRGNDQWMDAADVEMYQFADGLFTLEELTRHLDNTFTGTEGADLLDLGAGDDRAFALGGDDTILTGPGFERIDGGAGTDTVVLSGNRADYGAYHFTEGPFNDIFATHDDVVGIYHNGGGAYVETADVELFQFADGTFTLAELIPDFIL